MGKKKGANKQRLINAEPFQIVQGKVHLSNSKIKKFSLNSIVL